MLLGDNLLPLLVLAFGGAMAVGNVLAVLRPPDHPKNAGDLPRAPAGRAMTFAAIGALAALWAIASLIGG